ncbi:MAG: NADH-quinone oxidoreductase subunit H [Bryobacteraceae bacterium]|nr:NADH-quinone oxidoreductase subunit H [Bryobacteraceae bacterium]
METVIQHPLFAPLVITAVIIAVFPLLAGYIVLVERKVLADIQVRLGPMRVGPHGILQPIADAVKLLQKEDIIPTEADRALFWLAPVIPAVTALTAFAVLPFSGHVVVTDVNVGLLLIAAMSAVGILGIIIGGWSSNSHYPLLGALRSSAQLVSYEVALSLGLIAGVMSAGSLSMLKIVEAQRERGVWFVFDNYGLMIIPFMVFLIAAIAETNRLPFDLPEAESELVAGFMTEYSGFRWALFFLAEYASIFVIAGAGVTLFWGGWLRPFPSWGWLDIPLNYVFPVALFGVSGLLTLRLAQRLKKYSSARAAFLALVGVGVALVGLVFLIPPVNAAIIGVFWFLTKVGAFIYFMIWIRGTFPRFRYDQLMNIGWKVLIPVAMGGLLLNAIVGMALA